MKKKQFNEYVARKVAAKERRRVRNYHYMLKNKEIFSLGNRLLMQRGLDRHTLLMASGVTIFESRSLPGMDTIFGELKVSSDQRQAAAVRRTIDFVRDPYKINEYTRGGKLTRAARKQLIEKVLHYARVERIDITRRQIDQIARCYCPYKPERSEPIDPFMGRLRSERYHMQWVVDLARLCLTYVQLGSDYPMWTYYKSGRNFTYAGLDTLRLIIRNRLADDGYVKRFTVNLENRPPISDTRYGGETEKLPTQEYQARRSQLEVMLKADDIIDGTNAATQDTFVDAAKADFRKIAHHLPKDES